MKETPDDDGQLSGIVTDRDIVVGAVADGRDPGSAAVGVLTQGPIWPATSQRTRSSTS